MRPHLLERGLSDAEPVVKVAVERAIGGVDLLALSREARGPLLAAAPEYLEAAFEEIDSAHGSFDGYLYERLGVTESALEQMRAHLLED